MSDNIQTTETPPRLAPGDIIAIDTAAGVRHVQVTHLRAPYPDVLRAIRPTSGAEAANEIAAGDTAFCGMVELARAFHDDGGAVRRRGHATIPEADRAFPLFRLPIRNRAGEIVYWWTWDGDSLSVAPEAAASDLPIREVLPLTALSDRLEALG